MSFVTWCVTYINPHYSTVEQWSEDYREIQKIKFVLTTPRKNLTSMINIYKNFVLNDILFFYFREIAELSNKNCRYLASQIVFPCSALIFSKINVFYILTK